MSVELGIAGQSRAAGLVGRLAAMLPAFYLAASRGAALVVQFLLQLMVANLTGAAGLGLFQLFSSWTCILGEVQAKGLPARTMRVVAVAFDRGDHGYCEAHLRQATRSIIKAAFWVALAGSLTYLALRFSWQDSGDRISLSLVMWVVLAAPLFALLRVSSEALKGADAPLRAISIESVAAPLLTLLVCLVCWRFGLPLEPTILLAAGAAGIAMALLISRRALVRQLLLAREAGSAAAAPIDDAGDMRALWANSVLAIVFVQLPFLLLPWFADTAAIGAFAVAHKLVNVITLLLVLMAAVFGPAFARAARDCDAAALRSLLQRSQYLSLAIFTPLALGLLLLAGPIAALFKLPGTVLQGYLAALIAGQLVNAATGLPGVLLNMTGAARQELKTLVLALAFAVLLAPAVGYLFGSIGIAWLVSATVAFKNVASIALARRHLNQLEDIR